MKSNHKMFGMFFLTLCFYSFSLWMNLGERWCLLASSALTLIIPKSSPKYASTPLQALSSVIWRLWICLVTPWSMLLSNMLLGTWGQPNSLNFDLPHYLEELPSLFQKGGCAQAGERIFLLRKSLWAAPSGNKGLHSPIKMEVCSSVMQDSWEHTVYMCVTDIRTFVFIRIYIPVCTCIDIRL